MDIYGFVLAGSLITMGTLGDRIGRRRLLLLAGAGAFGTASVLAAYSTSPAMLIAARALLGIAGATIAPTTLSLIRNMFLDPKQRTIAVGVWISSFSAGGAVGPLLGGVLLEWFWWGSVFLLAVPLMGLLIVLAPLLLPEFRDPKPGRLDLASVALSLTAMLLGFWLLTQLDTDRAMGLAVLVTGSIVFSLGLGPVDTLAADLTVGAAPPQRAGAASAITETSAEVGGAMGIAILGVIGAAVYRGQVVDAIPAGVPPELAGEARNTLGGATAAADHLPNQLGDALIGTARQAFMSGLHLVVAISAAIGIAAAIAAAFLLRRAHQNPHAAARPDAAETEGTRSMSAGTYNFTAERVLDAAPEDIFDTYVDPDAGRTVFSGGPDWVVDVMCDLRVGGVWNITSAPPEGAAYREVNRFTVIDRPRRLAFTSILTMPDGTDLSRDVDVTFNGEDDGKTRMTIAQKGFPNPEVRDAFGTAFPGIFDRLERLAQARTVSRHSRAQEPPCC